jgi:dUTP pyrophosphatase
MPITHNSNLNDGFENNLQVDINFVKLHPDAVAPKSNPGDVGFDLASIDDYIINPQTVAKIKTGVAIDSIPYIENYNQWEHKTHRLTPFFKVEGRSGVASKAVFPVGGIIDPIYRGEVIVALYNGSAIDFVVLKGQRIAQLVCYITIANIQDFRVRFNEVGELIQTTRGSKGFGSSGQ